MPHVSGHVIDPYFGETQEARDPFGVFQRFIAGQTGRNPFLQRLAESRFSDLHALHNLVGLGRSASTGLEPSQTFQGFLGSRGGNPFAAQQQQPGTVSSLSGAFRNIIDALSTPEEQRNVGQISAATQFAPNEQGRFRGLEQAALLPTLQRIAPAFRGAFRRGAENAFQRFGSLNPGFTPRDFESFLSNRGFIS
jgi:hypothetical protein